MTPRLSSRAYIVLALGLIAGAAISWSTLAGRAAAKQAAKPLEDTVAWAEPVRPPEDLPSMIAATDLTALVQIVSSRTEELPLFADQINTIATVYQARLLETFRHNDAVTGQLLGQEIQIVQVGGTVDRGTHWQRLSVPGFSMLEPGQKYVLFLMWNKRAQMWQPNGFGPDGTFKLTDNTLKSEGHSNMAKVQAARSADDFLQSLRQGGF